MGGEDKLEKERVVQRSRLITILGDDNFGIWKWNLKYNLKSLGLYDNVTQSDKYDPNKDDEAMFEIIGTLGEKIKTRVSHCKNAKELYQTIEGIYTNKTSFQLTALHMKLSNFKFKSMDGISEGLSEIQNIVTKIKNLGEQISDHMIEGVILSALPSSFRTFITVWKGSSESERTLGNLMNRIMSEIEDNKAFNQREDKALYLGKKGPKGKGRNYHPKDKSGNKNRTFRPPSSSEGGSNQNGEKTCNYCKKPGHLLKDCRKLAYKRKMEEQAKDGKDGKDSKDESKKEGAAFVALKSGQVTENWIVDSGASCHMTANSEWLQEYQELDNPRNIHLGNDEIIQAFGYGNIQTSAGWIMDVYFVPKISLNLFSIASVTSKGFQVRYDEDTVKFFKGNELFLEGYRDGNLYFIDFEIHADQALSACVAGSMKDWHQRIGHVSNRVIRAMAKSGIVDGLIITDKDDQSTCGDCAKNKGHAVSHPSSTRIKADKPGISLHLDTAGPFRDLSLGGSKFFVLIKDEATSYRKAAFVESKADVAQAFKAVLTETKFETKNDTLRVCSDNGTEIVNQTLKEFFREKGIKHETSAPYTPQQNGFIERDIRTVEESARTMLNQAKLPRKLWAEAVSSAIYVLNMVPTSRNPKITPYEAWFGVRPNLKNLRIFGQEAIVNRPIYFREGKWDLTGESMRVVGYTNRSNTYRFYNPQKDKIIISCDVTFLDNNRNPEIINSASDTDITPTTVMVNRTRVIQQNDLSQEETFESSDDTEEISDFNNTFSIDNNIYDDPMEITDSSNTENNAHLVDVTPRIPKNLYIQNRPPEVLQNRTRPRSSTFDKGHHAKISTLDADDDPTSYYEAMKRKDKNKWLEAMKEEINSINKNKVWELVDRPEGTNIVQNRWVCRKKKKPNGEVDRYRARLVAKGFSQEPGVDYDKTYAPVIDMIALRLLFVLSALLKLIRKHFDVKTAFLCALIDKLIHVEQPEGFNDGTNRVCLLKKSLYGLKQAPRQWNKEFSNFLKNLNLKESQQDRCIFYRLKPSKLFIAIYVDDGIIFAEKQECIDEVMYELKRKFDIHEVDSSSFLGFQITSNNDESVSLHQESYIHKILKKFNMQNSNTIDNPSTITRNSKEERDSKALDQDIVPYREAIGSLLYASGISRIDIAYSVNKASRQVANPSTYDWQCVKRIFRYLKDKENACITYSKSANEGLIAYCDADFAGDDSGKSTTGYVILFGGGPIAWKSQKQPLVTLSSTEAELVSLCSLVKELIWIRQLALELGCIDNQPTTIYCDNESAIRLATNENSVQRTRHMGVRAAYTREQIENKQICVKHVRTEHQAADFLTKPMTSNKFILNRNKLMYFLNLVLLMITICSEMNCTVFEETKPIIWIPTQHFVDTGITEYEIYYSTINPCASLENHFKSNPTVIKRQMPQNQMPQNQMSQNQILQNQIPMMQTNPNNIQQIKMALLPSAIVKTDDIIINSIIKECNMMYNNVYFVKINELVSRTPNNIPNYGHRYAKRGILSDALETTAEVACGICVSNLISSVFNRFYPHSDHNRIIAVEEVIKDHKEKVQTFEKNFNITYEINKGILHSMQEFSRSQREANRQIHHLAELMPRVSWVSSYIQSRVTAASSDLRTIIDEYSHGRVACKEISDMLNIPALQGIDNADTRFESAELVNPQLIKMKFAVREKSPNTFVYKVNPFMYWENLTGMPNLMEYRGDKFLIFNESSNCLKAIDEPSQRAVLEDCTARNYTDPRLQYWQTLISTTDIYAYNHTCQVKRTLEYNYIYCFPWNITTKTGIQRAPPYVFRLPINQGFEVPTMKYTPLVRKLNITSPFEFPAVDSVHLGHFPMGSEATDELKWYDEIQRLRKLNEQLLNERDSSINIVKHGATWWVSISFITILVITTVGLVTYNLYISDRSSKRHKTMARDILELKSNYCDVKIDCPTCNKNTNQNLCSNSASKIVSKEKQRIEVGKDESITINLNRPLPALPRGTLRDSL